MGRILGIDFGVKRVGVAVTDTLQISVNGLASLQTDELHGFLSGYLTEENVECIVVGIPSKPSDEFQTAVERFVKEVKSEFEDLQIAFVNEDFSSRDAMEAMIEAGIPKQKRRDKGMLDQMSASLILQQFMNQHQMNS